MRPNSTFNPSGRETHERRFLVGVGVAATCIILASSAYALFQFATANTPLLWELLQVVLMAALLIASLYSLGGATLLALDRFR